MGGLCDYSVSPSPFGFGTALGLGLGLGLGGLGLGLGLDNNKVLVLSRGGARYFFVRSILMMASFHTFTSEVCENILLEGLFQNFKLFLAF